MKLDIREYLLERDGGCVSRFANSPFWRTRWPMLQGLPRAEMCADRYGNPIDSRQIRHMTIEEVKIDAPGEPGSHLRMGVKAGYSAETCVVMCWGHHIGGHQWCTQEVVRGGIRLYIVEANLQAARRGLVAPH